MQSAKCIPREGSAQDNLSFAVVFSKVSLAPVRPLSLNLHGLATALRPNNIISSAVAVDLAGHPKLAGTRSLGTVTGIINGSGSVVAAMGEAVEMFVFLRVGKP